MVLIFNVTIRTTVGFLSFSKNFLHFLMLSLNFQPSFYVCPSVGAVGSIQSIYRQGFLLASTASLFLHFQQLLELCVGAVGSTEAPPRINHISVSTLLSLCLMLGLSYDSLGRNCTFLYNFLLHFLFCTS